MLEQRNNISSMLRYWSIFNFGCNNNACIFDMLIGEYDIGFFRPITVETPALT